jgi:predicted kinase
MASTTLNTDIERVLDAVGPPRRTTARPALVVLVGLPATGKTHLARKIAARCGATVLESDALRRVFTRRPTYSPWESRRLFAAIHGAIDRLLADGASLILDATNVRERERRPLYETAASRHARLVLVQLEAPAAVVRERLALRAGSGDNSAADIHVFRRMQRSAEVISRPHHVVDSSKSIERTVGIIVKEIAGS